MANGWIWFVCNVRVPEIGSQPRRGLRRLIGNALEGFTSGGQEEIGRKGGGERERDGEEKEEEEMEDEEEGGG